MLRKWLSYRHREVSKYKFSVIDVNQSMDVDENIIMYLANKVLVAHVNPDMLKDEIKILAEDAEEIGLGSISSLVSQYLPDKNKVPVRVGNFGEVLASNILVEFENFWFPIHKLRYREKKNWSMRLTDICLIQTRDSKPPLVCYGEVKTRSGAYSANLGLDGHKSLATDDALSDPEILKFIASVLHNAKMFEEYRFITQIRQGKIAYQKRHDLFIIHEESTWKEDIIENLNSADLDAKLVDFSVKVVLIKDLKKIMDDSYDKCASCYEVIQ